MTPQTTERTPPVLCAFLARLTSIEDMLNKLQAEAADHFSTHPDELHYGHVGTLGRIEELLRQACEAANIKAA